MEHGFLLGMRARHQMEVRRRDGTIACRPLNANGRIERHQRHRHVGRMRGDAVHAGSQDGVRAIEAMERRATGARFTLVARGGGIPKVCATCALKQIAARRGHVPQLRRRARQQRLREHRVASPDHPMIREVAIPDQCAYADAAVGECFHIGQRQCRDIHDLLGMFDVQLHQIEQRRTTSQIARVGHQVDVRAANCPHAIAEWVPFFILSCAMRQRTGAPIERPRRCHCRPRIGRCCRSCIRGHRRPLGRTVRRVAPPPT